MSTQYAVLSTATSLPVDGAGREYSSSFGSRASLVGSQRMRRVALSKYQVPGTKYSRPKARC